MSKNIFSTLIVVLVVCSCKREPTSIFFSEESKILIEEEDTIYLNYMVDWVVDESKNEIYLSSNENQVLKLNTINGKLSNVYIVDSTKVYFLYKGLVQHFSNLDFKWQPNDLGKEYTVLVDRFWLKNDTLFVDLTSQFDVIGSYFGQNASIYTFFSSVLMFNTQNGEFLNSYYIPNQISNQIDSVSSLKKTNYISTQFGLAYFNDSFYFSNGGDYGYDSLQLLFKIPHNYLKKFQDDTLLNKNTELDTFLIDLKTIDENKDGRLRYYMSSTIEYKDKLYFSEGKNIYDVEKREVYARLIDKSFQHLNTFNFLPSGNIIYDLNNDTVLDRCIVYYNVEKETSHKIKTIDKNVKKILFGVDYIYELLFENEKYYLIKYNYEER